MPKRKKRQELQEGLTFSNKYKGALYSMKTVKVNGKIKYKVGKTTFNSPTAAAKSITLNSVNGWTFWSIE
jgi:hypothetical protein